MNRAQAFARLVHLILLQARTKQKGALTVLKSPRNALLPGRKKQNEEFLMLSKVLRMLVSSYF